MTTVQKSRILSGEVGKKLLQWKNTVYEVDHAASARLPKKTTPSDFMGVSDDIWSEFMHAMYGREEGDAAAVAKHLTGAAEDIRTQLADFAHLYTASEKQRLRRIISEISQTVKAASVM